AVVPDHRGQPDGGRRTSRDGRRSELSSGAGAAGGGCAGVLGRPNPEAQQDRKVLSVLDATVAGKNKVEVRGGRIKLAKINGATWVDIGPEPVIVGRNSACKL